MSFAIMRAVKMKGHQIHFSQNHNERNNQNYSNQDIDLEKTKDNYHLVESENYSHDTEKIIKENYAGTKNIRKDAVKNVEVIFTSDKDFFDKLSPEDERKFFEKSLEFSQEYFGEKNIFSAVVHKDETTPHMHLNFVPITKDGKLSAKEVIGNRKDLEKMQDKYFEKISKHFPELERGKKKSETNAIHTELREYKKQVTEAKDKQDERIKSIFENAKPALLSNKVSVEKKDLAFMANKSYKTVVAEKRADEFKSRNSFLERRHGIIKEENEELSYKVKELRSDKERLDDERIGLQVKNSILEREKDKDKKILDKFLEQHNLKEKFKDFSKSFEKTVNKVKARVRTLVK